MNIGIIGRSGIKYINSLAIIGDSRARAGIIEFYRGVTSSDLKGCAIDLLGCGYGITTNIPTGNTIEFRASDTSFRWTVSGIAPGAWTKVLTAQRVRLESSVINNWVEFNLRSILTLPTIDQTIQISISGALQTTVNASSSPGMVGNIYSNLNGAYYYNVLGMGGGKSNEMVESLPYLGRVAGSSGIDVIRIGANDISNNYTSATTIANAKLIFDNRIANSRKLVICGESARWGVNTSTPLTNTQLGYLFDINYYYRSYALANTTKCIYVDLFSLSCDPQYTDGRPSTGYLIDTVHDGYLGAKVFGNAIASAIQKLGGVVSPFPNRGTTKNLNPNAWFIGVSGTNSTGSSGVVATGWTVARQSGVDLVTVNSITASSDHLTTNQRLSLTFTAGAQTLLMTATAITIASAGLVNGDRIWFEVDVDFVSGTNVTSINPSIYIGGTNSRADTYITQIGESKHRISTLIDITATTTNITPAFYINTSEAGTAVVDISEFCIYKK